eukprot:4677152-Prymnesium_polylepis.1
MPPSVTLRFFVSVSAGAADVGAAAGGAAESGAAVAAAGSGAAGLGFHTNFHSVRSSCSAHALSLSGIKSKLSMKSYVLKHGCSRVAMAYVRFTAGSRLVTQRSMKSSCMS